jgi:hypothetical protein
VSVTGMADVRHHDAGVASGLMTTAHELGAAIGVAVFAAIGTAGAGIADGYGDGFLVAAGVAGVMAVVTVVALPSVRPAPGMAHAMH